MRRVFGEAEDRGAVAILVSVFSIVMFVVAALIVDLGMARVTRRDAQNAADAAALAAANALYPSGSTPDFTAAVTAAKAFASSNYGTTAADWSGCSTTQSLPYTPAGESRCISFDSATTPVNVRVIVPGKHVSSFFGGAVGYRGMDVSAMAQALVDRSSHPSCVFCVLGNTTHALQNGNVTVADGDVYFNGSITMNPNGGVAASGGTTYIQGTATPLNQVSNPRQTGVAAVTDPLAASIVLPPAGLAALTVKSNPCTQGPGLYGSVSLGNSACVLTPGLYTFTDTFALGNATSHGARCHPLLHLRHVGGPGEHVPGGHHPRDPGRKRQRQPHDRRTHVRASCRVWRSSTTATTRPR